MTRLTIPGPGGYPIPCVHTIRGDETVVLIICHGFGSSKESPTAAMLSQALPALGVGTLAFDFPAHGDSPVDGDALTLENCVADLAAAEALALTLAPGCRPVYFGSSYGALVTLLYLSTCPHRGEAALLRSAAVEPVPLFVGSRTPEQQRQLDSQGFYQFDFHYPRPLKLTRPFFRQLEEYDPFRLWKPGCARLEMVHGDADVVAPLAAAERFAAHSGARLTVIPGGDHRLSVPGAPEKVLEMTKALVLDEKIQTRAGSGTCR